MWQHEPWLKYLFHSWTTPLIFSPQEQWADKCHKEAANETQLEHYWGKMVQRLNKKAQFANLSETLESGKELL